MFISHDFFFEVNFVFYSRTQNSLPVFFLNNKYNYARTLRTSAGFYTSIVYIFLNNARELYNTVIWIRHFHLPRKQHRFPQIKCVPSVITGNALFQNLNQMHFYLLTDLAGIRNETYLNSSYLLIGQAK